MWRGFTLSRAEKIQRWESSFDDTTWWKSVVVARCRAAGFTWAQVGVEAFPLQHDEQGAPAKQHSRAQQVLNDRCHRHPPAPPVGLEERGRHGCCAAMEGMEGWMAMIRNTNWMVTNTIQPMSSCANTQSGYYYAIIRVNCRSQGFKMTSPQKPAERYFIKTHRAFLLLPELDQTCSCSLLPQAITQSPYNETELFLKD